MNVIKNIVYAELKKYSTKFISDEDKLLKDLSIYGDDLEELVSSLSKELKFDIYDFFNLFDKKGFYSPSEFYLKLPKIFYINFGKLLKGKIAYQTIDNKGQDITVDEFIRLLIEVSDNNSNHS